MSERGSVLLESLLAWTVLFWAVCLAVAVVRGGIASRLEEHGQFLEERKALRR
jgi:hypothetical protein